jgi:hypothetical protein
MHTPDSGGASAGLVAPPAMARASPIGNCLIGYVFLPGAARMQAWALSTHRTSLSYPVLRVTKNTGIRPALGSTSAPPDRNHFFINSARS